MRKRIGVFGWGVVAPKSPTIDAFSRNLIKAESWLSPFKGYGPSNFLVGAPDFDFSAYKPWVDEHFEPRKFSQLDSKMGEVVKFGIGAFIQALGQNPGIGKVLSDLGQEAHIYVGTGLADLKINYDVSCDYYRAQRRWNKFWCHSEHHSVLAHYRVATDLQKDMIRTEYGAPTDPESLGLEHDGYEDALDNWYDFWVDFSDGLQRYLAEVREIESQPLVGDVDQNKGHMIRRKAASRIKLNKRYNCPVEPWSAVDARLLWNIPNITAAQISMLGRITGPVISPVAACSGFISSLKMAETAIRTGQAKACVIGMSDPAPHALSVGAFYGARVVAHDGEPSKPFTGLKGTHISGGSCIWIVGDYDYFSSLGMKPVGLEILGIGLSADAHHIITPNEEGPRNAVLKALEDARVSRDEVVSWDMHATATPGDWTELQGALKLFPKETLFTARKGSFGHGMSVCGGWELTAQHMGLSDGKILPTNIQDEELHESILPEADRLVKDAPVSVKVGPVGKINMGVGGLNACLISKPW